MCCYGPDGYWLAECSKAVQSRLALYHGVRSLHINFTPDAEETFCNALQILQVLISIHNTSLGAKVLRYFLL